MGSAQIKFACLILLCSGIFGCKTTFQGGHYEGNIYLKTSEKTIKEPVSLEVSRERHRKITIHVINNQKTPITSLEIQQLNRHSARIRIDSFGLNPIIVNEITHQINSHGMSCYVSNHLFKIEFCYDSNEFLFQLLDPTQSRIIKLSGSQFDKEEPFNLETPVTLTLSQAIERAFQYNEATRIAEEHTSQAKHTRTAAFLLLFPHLTANLIWNAQPSFVTAIATLQGLTPFLLPNYWLKAFEANTDIKIKQDALRIIQANLATKVEVLIYSLKRDQQIYSVQQEVLEQTIKENKNDERIPSMELNLNSLKNNIINEKYEISSALGNLNPEAISDIVIDQEELPIEKAFPLEHFTVAKNAANRSFEVRQLKFMAKIATLKGVELAFEWIDPTGDPSRSLGLNTIPQVIVAHSQVKELKMKKKLIQTKIFGNVYQLINEYNQAIGDFKNRSSDTAPLREGENENQKFSNVTDQQNNLAKFRIARAKLDRLLLSGAYKKLLPHLNDFELETENLNLNTQSLALNLQKLDGSSENNREDP